uniref:tRNA lysidine(34) synthetase TilS n=1 Tax=Altererythrobacter segetis TaxID=1104773 RepID=UPI00140B0E41|nr:tRNA lysidine(34) synthetase TilS [Altererythrobacter segetis]
MTGTASKPVASDGVTPEQAERFAADLGRLWPEDGRFGLAVSGGPDSLALLLLAHAARPGRFAVATVDHGLRPEAAAECALVERACADRGIACAILKVELAAGNLQAEARAARYAALAEWAEREGVAALVTAHHADDQAETLIMRLNRASGLAGLAGVRSRGVVPGARLPLLRPLLSWRRAELAAIVAGAGLEAVQDPSNADEAYDRVRIRKALAAADWLDAGAVAASAEHLADADEALGWMVEREMAENVSVIEDGIRYEPGAPKAVAIRVAARIVGGFGGSPRGGAVSRLVDDLTNGEGGNVAGVAAKVCDGGWVFQPEPPRRS